MAVAIEDAGFQIRDQIMWVYGSGFPKSHNISLAIDKAAGLQEHRGSAINVGGKGERKDIETSVSALNGKLKPAYSEAKSVEAQQWNGWGTALKPAHEPIVLARKPLEGTVANNVLTHGVGGLNIDGTRVIADGENFDNLKSRPIGKLNTRRNGETDEEFDARVGESPEQLAALAKLKELGRFPANFIHDGSDEVVALFPTLHGSGNKSDTGDGQDKDYEASSYQISYAGRANRDYGSKGGSAARFFYCAKASKRDRNEGLEGFEATKVWDTNRKPENVGSNTPQNRSTQLRANHHPTVKPTSLMQYLIRLVTPPNGIVLDPFMGSGSTGKACAYEGFDFIGIDQSAEYVAIAQARIDFALADKATELPL
jgi:site-specific DNA-methyltransferase (adenine-specific)